MGIFHIIGIRLDRNPVGNHQHANTLIMEIRQACPDCSRQGWYPSTIAVPPQADL